MAALVALSLGFAFLATTPELYASAPAVPPRQEPTPTPPSNPITQIINQIIQFPFENLTQALQNALQSILNNSVAPLESIFSASIGRWLTSSPGIVTPGGGIANGEDVMGPAWRLMIKIAVLLWPLTLAIIATIAAKDAVAAASWGIGDLKEALGGWVIAALASATSLYWLDLANRFSNGTTMAILDMSFTGEAGFQPNALTALVFGTAGILLTYFAPPASLFIVIFVILLGLAVLTALIFQFMARFVVLYVLVALAPVVMILGVLPPMRWFSYTWLRGFVLVEAVGPINALLLKLVMILTVRGASNDPIAAFVNFIGALGVLSILLTIDGVIIKSVFGAVQEIAQKAMNTVTGIATLALAGATALAGGSIAAGGVGAAGSAAAGGGSGGSGSTGGGAAGIAGAGSNGSGPAQTARNAFSPGTALRGAGDVLFRQPGPLGSLGAAMRSVGGTIEQHDGNAQVEARWQAGQASHTNATQPGSRGNPRPGAGATGSSGGVVPPPPTPNAPSAPGGSSVPAPTSGAFAPTGNPRATHTSMPQVSATGIQSGPNTPSTPVSPGGNGGSAAGTANPSYSTPSGTPAILPGTATPPTPAGTGGFADAGVAAPAGAALPPVQTPSMTPMGEPIRATAPTFSGALAPEAASTLGLLPASLRDRGASLVTRYAPQDQVAVARAAVESISSLEFAGQFSSPGAIATAWDRGMAPVVASAREGLPLVTMAQDAGFAGNVAGFISHRITQAGAPQLESPSQPVPWHPQLAPHDWETGTAIAQGVGQPQLRAGDAARLYHEIRSPESGDGWAAGTQFVQTVREALQGRPADPIQALNTRLAEMEARGTLSATAMALWRANVGRMG